MSRAMKVKICGIARYEDLELADAVADYVGFIVDPAVHSRRRIDLAYARDLASTLSRAIPVLVYLSRDAYNAVEDAARYGFPVVQHHGRFPDDVYEFASGMGIKVAPVATYMGQSIEDYVGEVKSLLAKEHEYVLVDAAKGNEARYEHGLKVPLRVYRAVARLGRVALAGGIGPDNVHAVRALEPYMIDVASGVEAEPGVKDPEKIAMLVRALR